MSLFVLSLFAVQSVWDDPNPKGRWAAPTKQLAAELLPPEWAEDAVSHVVGRGIQQGGPPSSVSFEGRPRQAGDGFCARKTYYVSVLGQYGSNEGEPQRPVIGEKIRLGNCDGIFAHINPGTSLDEGKRVLRWLEWAREAARGNAPLSFALTCRDEPDHGKCLAGARSAMAALPIEKAYVITRDRSGPHHWQIAITETSPGQLLWDVRIDATPGSAAIDLAWKIPAPF